MVFKHLFHLMSILDHFRSYKVCCFFWSHVNSLDLRMSTHTLTSTLTLLRHILSSSLFNPLGITRVCVFLLKFQMTHRKALISCTNLLSSDFLSFLLPLFFLLFVAAAPLCVKHTCGQWYWFLLFELTSLSVRLFTPDCQPKSPDYGQQIPAVSRNAPLSKVFRVVWANTTPICFLRQPHMETLMDWLIQ